MLLQDLDDPAERRCPAYRAAVRDADIAAVFALPVELVAVPVGALDLYRRRSGPLSQQGMAGALFAADLAAQPLLDLLTADVDWASVEQGVCLMGVAMLERIEVNQART